MPDLSNNPLVAGRTYFMGKVPATADIPAYAAMKLVGTNSYDICAITDTDADVVAIALAPFSPGQAGGNQIPLCADFRTPIPVLSDGAGTIAAGDLLTLSATVAGRFLTSTSTGILKACQAAAATQDSVITALVFL